MTKEKVYQKCPECNKHFMDLRLHIWAVHLDLSEKEGKKHPGRDYSKIEQYIPKRK